MARVLIAIAAAMLFYLTTASPTYAAEEADDEYNFSWLDPDKKVYVLQNRRYRKAMRLGISAAGGLNLSNPYRNAYIGIGRADFWFSDQFGIEFFYGAMRNLDNDNLRALRNISASALPFVREHRSYYGGLLTWTPWYAKLNFFNKILYFDWFLFGGLGQVNTAVNLARTAAEQANFKTENFTAIYFGTGQNYFLSNHFVVRLDLLGMTYKAKGADNLSTKRYTNYDFTAGIGYLF